MIKLGDKVKDNITGFTGIVTGKIEYLTGCIQYEIQPEGLHECRPIESKWFDEYRLVVEEEKEKIAKGGSGNIPENKNYPSYGLS